MTLRKIALAVVAAVIVGTTVPDVGIGQVYAQEDDKAEERKSRRVPAMRARVYEQLALAQKLADDGKVEDGLAVLDRVQGRSDSMNAYERAMMWNFYGFIYYNQEDMGKAVEYFKKLIDEEEIPESLEKNTIFSLAQLSMMKGDYEEAVEYLEDWEELHDGEIPAANQMLKAQAYYQAKDYAKTLDYVNQAITMEEQAGNNVKENWYVLQRAAYYETKQPKKVAEVLEKMVLLFNKPDYWVQLAGMYGELGDTKKQLNVMEAAFQQGFVTKKSQIQMLAQLYFYHEVPYKAGSLMEKAIKDGVLPKDVKTLQFLAQAWSAAKNDDKAIPVLQQAAEISEDGNFDQRLGEIYLNNEKFERAITSTNKALQKGSLDNLGNAYLVLGMAHFNLKQFDEALTNLAKAGEQKTTARMAANWLKYVEREKATAEALAASI